MTCEIGIVHSAGPVLLYCLEVVSIFQLMFGLKGSIAFFNEKGHLTLHSLKAVVNIFHVFL